MEPRLEGYEILRSWKCGRPEIIETRFGPLQSYEFSIRLPQNRYTFVRSTRRSSNLVLDHPGDVELGD